MSIENEVYNLLHSSGVPCAQIGGLGYNKEKRPMTQTSALETEETLWK